MIKSLDGLPLAVKMKVLLGRKLEGSSPKDNPSALFLSALMPEFMLMLYFSMSMFVAILLSTEIVYREEDSKRNAPERKNYPEPIKCRVSF